jgi:hypothetical protein
MAVIIQRVVAILCISSKYVRSTEYGVRSTEYGLLFRCGVYQSPTPGSRSVTRGSPCFFRTERLCSLMTIKMVQLVAMTLLCCSFYFTASQLMMGFQYMAYCTLLYIRRLE